MSSINCKNTMKFILSDKVPDLTEFVEKRLEEFIDSLIIYFNHKAKPNLKKKFRRPKPVNLKHVYSCFDHIFPFLNPNKLNDSLIKKFDVVFCFLLHYDTSKINRPQAIKFFCQFLLFLNDSQIENYMFRSTVMVVPFIVFSRSENEKQSFLRIIPDNILPLGDPGQVESDEHDCVISMKQFLKFILEQWTIRPIICSNFFFMFLRILYPKMSTEHGFETFPCGFIDSNYNSNLEPPQLLFDCILQFLTELLETKNSLDPLFENAIKIQLFLAFLENCSKTQSLSENPLLLYRLEHQIIENPILVKRIQDVSLDLFGSLVNVLCIAISSCNKQENLRHASEFLEKFFPVMLSTIDRKILVAEIVKLFKKHHYEAFASSFLMMSFIHVLVNSNEANLDLWKCLTELVTTSDVLSAVACRYAQYLAVICFPLTVEENLERIKDIALNTYRRKQRTRQECSYDILMENMSDVIDKPDEYVRKNVLMSWEAHREFDEKIMKPLTIPAFQKKRSQILQKIELFLNAFAFYRTTEAAKDMRNAFAPIYSFCDLFITNRDLPPGFTIKSTLSLEVCMGRLFIAVLGQNEPTIRKVSFQLLARLVSCGALKKFFDNEILCKWYLSIATMMIHESPDFIEEGVSAALVTIQHGFTGSTTLIPMILNLIENKKIDVMKCLPFLSSIPLFQADINVNQWLIDELNKICNRYKKGFQDEISFLTQKGLNMRNRMIKIVTNLPQKKYQDLLPVYSSLLGDELSSLNPSSEIIKLVLNVFLSGVISHSPDAILVIRSIQMYSSLLINMYREIYQDFVTKIVDEATRLTQKDDYSFCFVFLQLTTELIIESAQLINSEILINYVHFLSNEINDFHETVKTYADQALSLISLNFKRYPFPSSVFFPMYRGSTLKDKNNDILATKLGNILQFNIDEFENVHVNSQLKSGHYNWQFSAIDKNIIENNDLETNIISFGFPETCNIINPSQVRKSQNDFVKMFDEYTPFENNSNPLEAITSEFLNIKADEKIIFEKNKVKNENHISKYLASKPNIWYGNPAAATATVIGLVSPQCESYGYSFEADRTVILKLKKLNVSNFRNILKIGVVFVDDNVVDQNDIFKTTIEETTPHFIEFLNGLGYPIDLTSHSGFDGGLDLKNGKTGTTSIFYADFNSELMFHVSPLLPTVNDDLQQIYKKRHIGNDHIHIVWSVNEKTYSPATITSQFNQAHIIVYPLESALFRVEVRWKPGMNWFGPLRHTTIVKKSALPSLVRATAKSAMLVFYQSQIQTRNVSPMNELAKPLDDICTNNCQKTDFSSRQSIMKLITHNIRESPNISLQTWHESTVELNGGNNPNGTLEREKSTPTIEARSSSGFVFHDRTGTGSILSPKMTKTNSHLLSPSAPSLPGRHSAILKP